jgi:hypothetical protein
MGKIINISVKPYTLTQLAGQYGVCTRTFKGWLNPFAEELGGKIGRFYSVKQVEIIYDNLGFPYTFREAA